jgi:PAS domain S-box-containing protein
MKQSAITLEQYREAFYAFDQGFCIIEMVVDPAATPIDYRFLEVNHAFESLTGLRSPVGKTALELVPNLEPHWIEIYGKVALTGESTRFVQGSEAMGRWFDVHASRIGAPEQRLVAVLFSDISALRREQEGRRKVEDALRISEERFRIFADTAPAMLWVTETDGSCSYLSRGWYEFTGQTEAEGLGFGWLDAVHPLDREAAGRQFAAANERRAPFTLEHRLRRADGAYRWVLDAGQPRLTVDGRFEGFIGSVIDIHDRKFAEDRLDLAVKSSKVGLWYCDLPFDILVWSPEVKEHFGLPADAVVTIDTFYERIHPDDREPTRQAIDTSITNRTAYDTQYRTVGLDGRVRWIRALGRAHYEQGVPVRFDGITVDITELVALREAAEAANLAKDQFLAMLGHELRNPLAPILTALQLIKLRGVDAVERERSIIERQVQHLVRLVDDLLDVARITRGRVDLKRERVEAADIVARAIEIASPLLEQQRHTLLVDVPRGLLIEGDASRLAQIVANLVNNAAKYTEPAGRVSISGREEGDDVVLAVRDTGAGIDAEMLPRIFDLFVQEPQALARSQGGLGLGLAIVRSLVELHGGSVTANSLGRGHGAEFVVRLPRAMPMEAGVVAPPRHAVAVPPVSRGTRVLIVDDNADAATMLGTLVREFGYEPHVTFDAPSALAAAERLNPHVALVDLGLPVMDGFELAERFAAHPELRQTRLIAVTGYGQPHDRETSKHAGFTAHLVKPVDANHLRAVLDEIASR